MRGSLSEGSEWLEGRERLDQTRKDNSENMARRRTVADQERIKRSVRQFLEHPPAERPLEAVRLACGHIIQSDAEKTQWLENVGVCEMCKQKQMAH